MVMVVSPSFKTRLPVLTVSLGIDCPLASPDSIDHSPSSRAISFLTGSGAPAAPIKTKTAITGRIRRIGIPLHINRFDGRTNPFSRLAGCNGSSIREGGDQGSDQTDDHRKPDDHDIDLNDQAEQP